MSTIEDRLSAALEARADLVQPEDLRPAQVPGPPASVTWLRHPATYVAAAAACAAVIAAPFLVSGGDGGTERSPAPPPSSVVPTELPPLVDVGGDWPAPDGATRADVDGDGIPDDVRVRLEPGEPLIGPRLRVEAELSSTGDLVWAVIDSGEVSANIGDVVQLDEDPGLELTVYRDGLDFAVLDLLDDRLVEPTAPETPRLLNGVVEEQGTGRGFESRVWVDQGALFSYLSDDSFTGPEPLETPVVYPVSVTSWSISEGRLVPSAPARRCIDVVTVTDSGFLPPLADCADSGGASGTGVPELFPEEEGLVGLGGSFESEIDGRVVTVALEGTARDGTGTVEEGDAELVVTFPGGRTARWPVGAGWEPAVTTAPAIFPGGGAGFLVRQEGGDNTTMSLVTVRGDRLTATLTEGEVPFGNGFVGASARTYRTWIGPDGVLWTRVAQEVGADEQTVYRWALGGTVSMGAPSTLQPLREGCFAIDASDPASTPLDRC
ncbi:hypothetical protein [Nocardioides psychrotolerans]|uniref:hypothetical protein n=1 Tax=Nocardioides psychrotolerans TaxID=1005945 RepID=UPI003137CC51